MAKKTRTELSTLAINTNLPDNTQELITPTTERSQLTDERESVVNYKDDLGGAPNAGKFLTVAVDGESLTMVDAPTGDVTGTGQAFKIAFWFDTKVITFDTALFFNTNNNRLTAAQFEATLKVISAAYEAAVGSSMTFATGETGDPSPTTRLTISTGGNVGIGTTSPTQAKLVIIDSDVSKQIVFSNNATYYGSISHNADTGVNEYRTEATGSHAFYKGTSSTPQLTISSGGETFWGSSPKQAYVYVDTTNDIALIGSLGSGMDLGFITGTGTNKLTISSGGLATFSNGIKFGTGATLDAYEEGTWTGTQVNDGVGLSSTGSYTRIGNTVFFKIYIGGTTTSAGLASVTGLPYSASSSNGYNIFSYVHGSSLANSRGGYISGTTLIPLTNGGTGGVDWVVGSVVSMFSGTYTI